MFRGKKVAAIIAGAGKSSRVGFDKLLWSVNGKSVAELSVLALNANDYVDEIIYVAGDNIDKIKEIFANKKLSKPFKIVKGAQTRQQSVKLGVLEAEEADYVAVHDAARPFATQELIDEVIEAAYLHGCAAPSLPMKDTVKIIGETDFVEGAVKRENLRAVQTPQVFKRNNYLSALKRVNDEELAEFTDDCELLENGGFRVFLSHGDEKNFKITTKEDCKRFEQSVVKAEVKIKKQKQEPVPQKAVFALRIGHGYDVHKFAEERKLIIGGVEIPYAKGLLGHSDADVLLHALSDALLGAVALGDIGGHFPDSAEEYKNANSLELLKKVHDMIKKEGYAVNNIDATIICQEPKLMPHIKEMRHNIAGALEVMAGQISVKATTEEGLGFTGAKEGIAAHCVVLLSKI